jgi:hypothetical protein
MRSSVGAPWARLCVSNARRPSGRAGPETTTDPRFVARATLPSSARNRRKIVDRVVKRRGLAYDARPMTLALQPATIAALLAALLASRSSGLAIEPPTTAPTNQPTDAPATPPATQPPSPTAPVQAQPVVDDAPLTPPPSLDPSDITMPEEPRKRAYIVVDRVTTAAGAIESDDAEVIVLRDAKGKIRSFTKSRVLSITYLLEGPAGRRVRVAFNDGRVLVGSLIEDGYEKVTIEIQGIRTGYDREAVNEVRPYPTDLELYQRFRDGLEPDQYGARYTLGLWLYNKKMYEEAKVELESLLEATNHYEAKQLLNEVNAQLALMAPKGADPTPRDERPRTDEPLQTGRGGRLLTDAEVNLIRVYELDLAKPPRMQTPEPLIRAMLEKYADSALIPANAAEKASYFSKDPVEIVRTLFALKARELYPQIQVLGEPDQLQTFKQRVHNAWLIGNCATSRCHGGPDAGRFYLHNRNHKDDNVRFTNMLILFRTRLDTLPLIDFERPTDSLVYQYALPKTEARRPHPDVRGWEPVLGQNRKGLAEDFVDWVRGMRPPGGEYPIDYTPPDLTSRDRPDPTGPDR